jgi:hypothetical protein
MRKIVLSLMFVLATTLTVNAQKKFAPAETKAPVAELTTESPKAASPASAEDKDKKACSSTEKKDCCKKGKSASADNDNKTASAEGAKSTCCKGKASTADNAKAECCKGKTAGTDAKSCTGSDGNKKDCCKSASPQ